MLHNSLHGCLASQGTGTGIIEAKLAQQLAHLEQTPFFGIFIDLRKAFDAMDCGCCLEILALHGVGPKMLRLIRNFWDLAMNVCWAKGNYGRPFKAGRGVTQGGPLLVKLFNIVINAVVPEWMWLMRTTINNADSDLAERIAGLFAVFYVNDGYIASRNAEFLQEALNILVKTFKQVGLATNTKKTQAMICTPGKIRVQLPKDSYKRMRERGGCRGGVVEDRGMPCMQQGIAGKELTPASLEHPQHPPTGSCCGHATGGVFSSPLQSRPRGKEGPHTVPVPRLPRRTQQSLYAAPPFPGSTPKGHHGNPEGGELPMLRALHDAV